VREWVTVTETVCLCLAELAAERLAELREVLQKKEPEEN